MATSGARRHWKGLLLTVVLLLLLLGVGLPFAYIHFIEGNAPPPLALPTSSPQSTATPALGGPASGGSLAGSYHVAAGSQAGYRVKETLAGQHATAVGRTSRVSGSMTIVGHRVVAASFMVDMASVTSDRSERDDQFHGRIMDVAQFPTGSFTLTQPIVISPVPPLGSVVTEPATGNLTLHGTTRPVRLTLRAERTTSGIEVTGTTTISYGEFGISNPSFGGFVSVGDSGAFEVLLDLAKS
jgi:polyisoprenoid-binding protein YceI